MSDLPEESTGPAPVEKPSSINQTEPVQSSLNPPPPISSVPPLAGNAEKKGRFKVTNIPSTVSFLAKLYFESCKKNIT